MFDSTMRQAAAAPALRAPQYLGPERRSARGSPNDWLVPMLDEIDYGMLVVNDRGQVTFHNHTARLELDGQHPLQLQGRTLQARRPQDTASLQDALSAAQRGLRRLLTLGEGACRVSLSVVPLREVIGQNAPFTLLLLGKRQVCEKLSVQGFARSVSLTAAETRVLEQLCDGVSPADIAARAGVQVCTVRTQIGSIRAKTGAASIRELVQQVAVLPPMVGALRHGMAALHG